MKLLILALLILAATRCLSSDWQYVVDKAMGRIADITIGGKPVALQAGAPCGVCVEEIAFRDGKLVRVGKSDRFATTVTTGKLGDALLVTAEVRDTKGGDSAADIFYQIPVDTAGWVWHQSIMTSKPAGEQGQDLIPISVLTNPKTGAGLAVAISPETPCMFARRLQQVEGAVREGEGGLLGALPSRPRLPRSALLSIPWMRSGACASALKRVLRPVPQSLRGPVEGATASGYSTARRRPSPNPTQFGFHSLGELGECRHIGRVAVDILTPDEVAQEKKWGIEIYPYVIPGQREVGFLDKIKGDGKIDGNAGTGQYP